EDHEQAASPLALPGAAGLPRLIVGTLHTTDGAGSPHEDPGAVAVSVVRVGPEEWAAHRDLRLDMLRDAPAAFWASLEEVRARTEQQWRQELRGPRIQLQARRGTEVLGGIAVLPEGYTPEHPIADHEIILASLWVRPAVRGSGVSRALLDAAARLSLDLGRPTVLLEVDDGNEPARGLYERLGFESSTASGRVRSPKLRRRRPSDRSRPGNAKSWLSSARGGRIPRWRNSSISLRAPSRAMSVRS